MNKLSGNQILRVSIFAFLVFAIGIPEYILYIERAAPGPIPGNIRVLLDILFPFYWFSIGAFIGGLILAFPPAALKQKFLNLFLWWIPITVAIIVLCNLEPTGGRFGISFPDPFAPEPLALFSGSILSITLVIRLVSYWIKKAFKK